MRLSDMTKNILSCYRQATDQDIEHGLVWYAQAKATAQDMADRHGIPLHIAVGVIAALSPTNKWERNTADADQMCEVFMSGGYVDDTSPCTYKNMRDKAWSILETMPSDAEGVASILQGPKITDFFWCIMGEDTCVIDGHAWCIAHKDRRTVQNVPSISVKLRKQMQKAYSNAGSRYGMTAYQMQAATWVAWKRLHNV